MPRYIALLALLTACFLAVTPAAFAVPVDDLVNLVSLDDYTNYLSAPSFLYTHNGNNRGMGGTDHDLARDNIYSELAGFGLDVSLDEFVSGSRTYRNVVGVHWGLTAPDDIYIIGAHYDSVGNPGADDNASGVAAVLEAASVLSTYDFAATLVFIAFDGEELGLIGSDHYAAEHSADNILGMISADMIAYNPEGSHHDKVALYTGSWQWDMSVVNGLSDAIALYGEGLTSYYYGGSGGSDHQSFEARNKPAALMIEDAMSNWSNPYYHQATDSVDTANYIDYEYATRLTRATVGYLAGRGRDIPEPSVVLLFASGALALVIVRRRRR